MYRTRREKEAVMQYITIAAGNDLYVFLDLQLGRASLWDQMEAVLPYLRHANVHIAIDPEYAWKPEQEPVNSIGYLTGAEINLAQQMIEEFLAESRVQRRVILIVHQFLDEMIRGVGSIQDYPNIDLVIDMDGFGPPDQKKEKYARYATQPAAEFGAIKLFYKYDSELMRKAEVLTLGPDVAIYQ